MISSEAILERWVERTVESYPPPALPFLKGDGDPFRNPVGHTLRESLAILLRQLMTDMDPDRIARAVDAIVRLRAVQDLSASQAVGFLFLLKPILRDLAAEQDQARLDDRIDQIALMAFDNYMRCREELADIRINESRRSIRGPMLR